MSEDWKAETYHRISEPQRAWGEKVLAELVLRGDESVMDAGCGTGRLTKSLLERLPRGRVVALDASPAMLEVARRELSQFGDRVSFVQARLGADVLPAGMDVVFSTATFHWVLDHEALLASIFCALGPGGRLHAQCGGEGNLRRARVLVMEAVRSPRFAAHFSALKDHWLFAGIEDTERRLWAAGFVDVDVGLENAPTDFDGVDAYREFMGSVVLRPYLAYLPEKLQADFVQEVAFRAERDTPPLHLDYVRLNLRARRA